MSEQDLPERNARKWDKHQRVIARRMVNILQRARAEMYGDLKLRFPEGDPVRRHYVQMVDQIDRHMARLKDAITNQAGQDFGDMFKVQVGAARAEMASLFTGFPSVDVAYSRFNPKLVQLSLENSLEYVKDIPTKLKGTIRQELALSYAKGEHVREAAKRIAGQGQLDGVQTAVGWQAAEQRAHVIAVTEGNRIASEAYHGVLEQAKEMGLPVGKSWNATLDGKTSRRCKSLDRKYNTKNGGKAIPLEEEFHADDGWHGANPPAHPRCRSRVGFGRLERPSRGKIERMDVKQTVAEQELERIKPGIHVGEVSGNIPKAKQHEVLEAAHKAGMTDFLEKHPLGDVNFGAGEKFGPTDMMGAYDPHTKRVSIKSQRAPGEYGQPLRLGHVSSISATGRDEIEAARISFIHELGHHMHYMASDTLREQLRQWISQIKPVSERANANWKEQFVEAHAAFVFYPEALKVFDENGYKMVVEIRKAMGIDR